MATSATEQLDVVMHSTLAVQSEVYAKILAPPVADMKLESMWNSPMACGGRCRMSSLIQLGMHGSTEYSLFHTSGTGEIPARDLIDQTALILPSIGTRSTSTQCCSAT